MTQAIAKFAAKKMLSKEMDKYKSKDVGSKYDPFYQEIPHPRKPGKTKKVKKQVPAYIPPHDADILARSRKTAYRMDLCLFNFLGFRFGWESVIGLVPAFGDAAGALIALKLIASMRKVECGLPQTIVFRMLFNMILDFVVGLVPFVGDLADAALKANSRNVRLLEQHLDRMYKPKRVSESEANMQHPPPPATAYEDFSDEEEERRNTFNDEHDDVRQPKRAYSSRKERVPDVEMGYARQDTHKSYKEKPSRHNTKSSRLY